MGLSDRIRDKGKPKSPQDADRLALRHLQGRGADLTQQRHVIHFLYFAEEEDARSAAQDVEGSEWSATVEPPVDGRTEWVVRADGYRVVDTATVSAFRVWFERIAGEHTGEYDGWEASAKP